MQETVKFAKFLRTPFLKNICERLLLNTEAAFQRCSAKVVTQCINAVMKYSFSAAVVQSWRALHDFATAAEQRY